MIIPVRCISCGKPVAQLWEKYQQETANGRKPKEVLDEIGLERYCCRSLFLTHVELIDNVGRFKK